MLEKLTFAICFAAFCACCIVNAQTPNLPEVGSTENVMVNQSDPANLDKALRYYLRNSSDAKAFQVAKLMYASGHLDVEQDILRLVRFHQQFGTPFHGASILEKEMDAGRVGKNLARLELLAALYEASREYEKALAVVRYIAETNSGGPIHHQMAELYLKLERWPELETTSVRALELGGLSELEKSIAWERIGYSNYQTGDRRRASRAFHLANSDRGRSWVSYINFSAGTLTCFADLAKYLNVENEAKACSRTPNANEGQSSKDCAAISQRLLAAKDEYYSTYCEARPSR